LAISLIIVIDNEVQGYEQKLCNENN